MAIVDADPDFDTLAHVRTLREAGVEQKQAEAHAEAARALRAGLATKADLDAGLDSLETRLDARFEARIADLRADIAALETRLTVRFFGGLVAVGGVIVAAVKLL